MHRVYRFENGRRLTLTASVMALMGAFRQLGKRDLEGGGVLLGRHLIDSEDLAIDMVTTPQKGDRRTRTTFYRSKAHDALVKRLWKESGGHLAHLGLWHTHPEPDPSPSNVDLQDWNNALANDHFDGDHLFFIIVGTEMTRIWSRSGIEGFVELEEVQEPSTKKVGSGTTSRQERGKP